MHRIVNSGIANACTGTEGYGYCEETAKAAAEVFQVEFSSLNFYQSFTNPQRVFKKPPRVCNYFYLLNAVMFFSFKTNSDDR